MVQKGRADESVRLDLRGTSSASTTDRGGWEIDDDDKLDEGEGIDANRCRRISCRKERSA